MEHNGATKKATRNLLKHSTARRDNLDDLYFFRLHPTGTGLFNVSSLDESRRTLSEVDTLPEDEDEELEMTLRSHGRSLVELYPSMISKMERALHRQKTSEAAGSVLRRYHKWRQQPKRSSLNCTFIVPPKSSSQKKHLLDENPNSPVKSHFAGHEPPSRSPLKMMNYLQDWPAQQQSPGKKAIFVMELSGSSPIKQMNKNFIPKVEEEPCPLSFSPSCPVYTPPKASLESVSPSRPIYAAPKMSLDMSAHSLPVTTTKTEMSDIYSSPVKRSPSKISISRSPSAYAMSPTTQTVERFPRDLFRYRSTSALSLKMLHNKDCFEPSLQRSPPPSPRLAPAAGRGHSLQRHASFDSAQLSRQVDEDIERLYQKFSCQSRSYSTSRGHSSTALAALALSPHRPLPRKRHRDLSWSSPQYHHHHQSKRSREEQCPSSPGPRFDRREMLRHASQGFPRSPGRHSLFQSSSFLQRSREAYQDSWMN